MIGQAILPSARRAFRERQLGATSPFARRVHSRGLGLSVQAQQIQEPDRRAALCGLLGVGALVYASPSEAAFGDAAGIFKREPTNATGLIPFRGKGFSVQLPSRWQPSRERDVPNVVLRYEDTGDNLNNVVIYKVRGGKDVGDPKAFLEANAYLFGQNVWQGNTISEGGFKKNKVSNSSLIDSYVDKKDGKDYHKMEVLTRTADGTEGGRHNLIAATSSGGELWVCKVQIGDKRWMRGDTKKNGMTIFNSFSVA